MQTQLFRRRRTDAQADEVHAHLAAVSLTWLALQMRDFVPDQVKPEQVIRIRSSTAQCTPQVVCECMAILVSLLSTAS